MSLIIIGRLGDVVKAGIELRNIPGSISRECHLKTFFVG